MPLRRKRRRRWQLQRPRLKCAASSGASRRAGRCLSICRASASSIPHPRFVRVAVGLCTKSARTSPRRWSLIPRQWKVIQHVREKFSCHSCKSITQPPASSHPISRAAVLALFYSPDRSSKHPEQHLANYAGLMQADAYAGFSKLYHPSRKPGAIIEAAGWAHARRKFFDLARLQKAPIAIEAVKRIDALFAIEREINWSPVSGPYEIKPPGTAWIFAGRIDVGVGALIRRMKISISMSR